MGQDLESMMQKLLVAVDGSETGNRAVSHAIALARGLGNMKLLLLNVQPTLERWYTGGLLNREALDHLNQLGRHDGAAAQALADAAGLSYEFRVLFGHPAEVITRVASDEGCVGIVLGTRGLGEFEQVFLGSTAYKVVQLTQVPVTLVK